MSKNNSNIISVKGFLLKIIIFLPIVFLLWYLLTPLFLYILSFLSQAVLTIFAGQAVVGVEANGNVLHIITPFPADNTNDVNKGQLVFVINAMKYGYGIALFTAMLLATPDKLSNKLQNFYIGLLILLLVQVWGVSLDTMQTLVFKLGEGIADTLNTTEFTRELIALGYQLGYLILPSITPIILWFVMYQDYLAKMAPKFAKIKK